MNGRCRPAQVLSGAATLSKARLDILTVACASIVSMACDQAGNCSGGGSYPGGKSTPVPHGDDPHLQALVVSVRQ